MQHFYDGQIRRYITQTIRFFSNFVVKNGDGSLQRIPVLYGDPDRQVASIMRQNSENMINSSPRISVYISELKMDRDRLSDSTYVGKLHFRNRDIDQVTHSYTNSQGRNYTVERIMPTPFKLTMKVDIWSANTEQKLQIMEQILVFFNPSLEFQTTDNYLDWTSLTVLNLDDINWSSRTVPVGNNIAIDIATLTVDTPIWLSPPVKVKQLGVITNIIANIQNTSYESPYGYIDGLGIDTTDSTITISELLSQELISIDDCKIDVYGNKITLISSSSGNNTTWPEVFANHQGQYIAGVSTIYLRQLDGSNISGTFEIDINEPDVLNVTWNPDTLVSNTGIDSQGKFDTYPGYNSVGSYRPNSPGTFDAIVDPLSYNPKRPNNNTTDQPVAVGTRFLIIEDIGNQINVDGADAWKSTAGVDLIANANDIIEWTGYEWNVIFNSIQEIDTMIWQTNIYTDVQYLWNGISWVKSYDKEYREGEWRLIL